MGFDDPKRGQSMKVTDVRAGLRATARRGVVVAAVLSLGLVATPSASAHGSAGYSNEATTGATNTDWMASLPGDTPLSRVSLPGTHDSGANDLGRESVETQGMSFQQQLRAGIRAWDIRLKRQSDGSLTVYHGPISQGHDFADDVLGSANSFLVAHPDEAIVMRIKRESGSSDKFDTAVKAALSKRSRVFTGTANNPLLRDIRGKIVVLQDFASATRIGIPWSRLAIQDRWQMTTNWDLADKWHAVRRQLDTAQNGPDGTIYANFLSGAGGSFPYFVASGHSSWETGAPRLLTGWTRGVINTCSLSSACIPEFPDVNCFLGTCSVAFEGTNILTMNDLDGRGGPHRYGIVYADFPGKGLIQRVISSNDVRGVIRGKSSGRCVDVPAVSHVNGTAVQLYDCHGRSNQAWTPTAAGELKVYGTKCLDVRGGATADGTRVQIYDCNGTGAQQWALQSNGSLVNTRSGKCLDAFGDGRGNGTAVVIWPCTGGLNQLWVAGPH